jgi:hypothetical protein
MISPVMYVIPDQPEIRQVVINSLFENAVLLTEPLPVTSPSL